MTARGGVNLHPAPHGLARTSPGLYPPLDDENPRPLGVCESCRAVHQSEHLAGHVGETVACYTCGALKLRVFDAREPRHFFATGTPKDYNGFSEIRGFTTRPTLAVYESGEAQTVGNAQLSSNREGEPHEILTFNDYGGRGGFFFVPVTSSLRDAYKVEDDPCSQTHAQGRGRRVALLARRRTDTLQIGLARWPQYHHAPPESVEGRAAWYSAAFALRSAASVMLDIEAGELEGGLYVTRRSDRAEAHAFLSDRLENGAGYASYLARPDQFATLLRNLRHNLRADWTAHAATCDTSCARCLRDYTNLGFHPLLDWRLALDLAELLGGPEPLSLSGSHWEALYKAEDSPVATSLQQLGFRRVREATVLPTFIGSFGRSTKAVVLRHPLWALDHPDVLSAKGALANLDPKVESPFMLLRRPSDAL